MYNRPDRTGSHFSGHHSTPITNAASHQSASSSDRHESPDYYGKLKRRLDQLIPDNQFSAEDLLNCKTIAPRAWRLIQVSLEREQVNFSQEEFDTERVRVNNLKDEQIGVLMRAIARFAVGEKVVEDELQPLIDFYNRGDGKSRYLALFVAIQQAEEKIHADFFQQYKENVFSSGGGQNADPRMDRLKQKYLNTDDRYSKPFRRFFTERLPKVLARLNQADKSTAPQFKEMAALTCYHIFAEGVVAESAYFAFIKALASKEGEILPTVLKGIRMIKQHESTHIAFGVVRLQEIMDTSWPNRIALELGFLANCSANLPKIVGIIGAVHREHPGSFPFPLDRRELALEGISQLKSRLKSVLFGKYKGSST